MQMQEGGGGGGEGGGGAICIQRTESQFVIQTIDVSFIIPNVILFFNDALHNNRGSARLFWVVRFEK